MDTTPQQQAIESAGRSSSRRLIQVGIVLFGIGLGALAMGTVQVIAVFEEVALLENSAKPADLAQGIYESLFLPSLGVPLLIAGLVLLVAGLFSRRRARWRFTSAAALAVDPSSRRS